MAAMRRLQTRFTPAMAALAAGWLVAATPAFGQDTPSGSDPFQQGRVYLEADEIVDDPDLGAYVARGNVEARYGGRILRAQEVRYYESEKRIEAVGGITILEEDGTVTFADEASLTDDLKQGFIQGFAARLANDGKLAASYVIRRDDKTELRRAFYTVCDSCEEEKGVAGRPTWRLRARRVVQDQEEQMIYYRDAVLEIKGVPVLYAPFFAHADPSAPRRSGLLLPALGESTRTGTFYEQPYYWAISPHQDLTLAPRIMSDANPLVSYEHRKRFFSGSTIIQGSLTHEQEFDDDGLKFGEDKYRGHIFGEGLFAITDDWRWGFGVERVSDDLYFRRYEIDDQDKRRGLFSRSNNRLLSQLFVTGQDEDFYASAAGFVVQGLRAGDEDDQFPLVLPYSEIRRVLRPPVLGGRIEARGSTAFLDRKEGSDSRRVTLEADWRRRFVSDAGVVTEPFALVRADIYDVSDVPLTGGGEADDVFTRELGYFGADLSWPLGRQAGAFDVILEPIASVVIAPYGGNDTRIPNEDSLAFDLDEANLFSPNRSPGYDIWEDGPRATVGGRATARWGEAGGEASLFLGQSYRAEDAINFSSSSGLDDDQSDIVGAARFAWDSSKFVTARFRLDESDMDVERLDVGAGMDFGRAELRGKYLKFNESLASGRPKEELSLWAGLEFTRHWGAYYQTTRDLELDETRTAVVGLVFDDECSRLELIYKRDGTRDRAIGSGDSFRIQFTLATIGSFGQGR